MRRFASLLLLTVALSARAEAQNASAPSAEDDEGVTVNLDAIGAPEPVVIPEIPPEGAIVPKTKPLPDAVQVKIVPLPRHKPVLAPADSAALAAPPPPAKAEPKAPEIVAKAPPKADLPVTIVENFPMEMRGVASDPYAGTKGLNPADGYTVIGRVRFSRNAGQMPTTAAAVLDVIAEKLLLSSERIRLAAYSGATGDMSSQSRRLSLERARAVRNYLVEKGVPFERMDVMPLGGAAAGQSDRVDILAPAS